jgi:triphosphoribosyl-dephospho-CoA synthase
MSLLRPDNFCARLSIGQCAELACLMEVTARKPGNVHRCADFDDVTFAEFIVSAVAIRPAMERAAESGVGQTVLEAVRATQQLVGKNTNLGMVLLLAPLAAAPLDEPIERGVARVLERLTVHDACAVYEAIRLAQPGGLGRVVEQDVADEPTEDLLRIMRRAADRDLVARQYANGFNHVFHTGFETFADPGLCGLDWEQAVILCHLRLMAETPDTLISRKRGETEAVESARRAAAVLEARWPVTDESRRLFAELDAWLRAEGHGRNPGATADLVAASLFVALRHGTMLVRLNR